jgi:AcrR family transcriptional regulator
VPRQTLTRARIVEAAIDLLDAEGLDGLSMRHLGERLDSAASAVYWHVHGKDNLVVLAGDALFSEIPLPDPVRGGWRTAAATMARGLHAMITRHPWLVAAMSAHLIYGPTKARHDDHALAVYETAGFTSTQADWALRTVVQFVLGAAMGQAAENAWRHRQGLNAASHEAQHREASAQATEIATRFTRLRDRLEAWRDADKAAALRPELRVRTSDDSRRA